MPEGYIRRMVDLVRNKYGGLIICDEVQTGFGRIGTQYWGHRWQGIKPDIVTMAKGIGNGFPMGAVVTRKEVTDKIKQVYFNTFGGGYLQCRAGMTVLDVIRKEKLPENCEKVGTYLLNELSRLAKTHKLIGNVRGKGLMIGIELVKNQETKEPAKEETAKLMELAKDRGVLLGKGGVYGNVIRFQPPFCFSMEDAKYTVEVLDDSLHRLK